MKCCTKCLKFFAKKKSLEVEVDEDVKDKLQIIPAKEKSFEKKEPRISHNDLPVPCIELTIGNKKIQVNSIFSHKELRVLTEEDNRLNSFVASSIEPVSNSSLIEERIALNNLKEEMNNHYANQETEHTN